ncbi:MAG: PAS domain S-box protein [Chthoniobacter sp.]|uniref:hybrid sensor histidine kinase/response regulator n=1 Tax=Chthoniobacter sp. TaxID=2510640 RepID=UPI0032AC649C
MDELLRAGFDPQWVRVDNEKDYLANLGPGLQLVLCAYTLPRFSSGRALELRRERDLDIPFIVISDVPGEETAVQVMKQGATDYVLKERLSRLGELVGTALEESKRRRSERSAAQTSRERATFVEDVFHSLSVEVVVVNERGEIIAANEAWSRFARENSGSDFLGQNYLTACEMSSQKFADADARAASKGLRSVLEGSVASFVMEYPSHSATEQRWFQMRVSPLHGAQRGAVIAHEKITERKLAEQAHRLFRDLMDHSIDALEIVDPETGRYLDVNERACTERGCTREEYLTMRVCDVDPMVTEANWPQRVAHIRDVGSLTQESLHRRQDGGAFPVEINARWVRLERDYIVAVVRDVTVRQQAEERVRELAAMLDLAHDAIIVHGFDDQKIRFWNKGAETLYGWTAAEAMGREIGALIFDDPTTPDALRQALLTTDERRGESRHRAKNGQQLIVNTRSTLVRDAAGQPKSVLSINTDITEQKKLEVRNLRAQRMESIGVLASGVAHDLGNILSPIKMCVPMLRHDLRPEVREELISTIEQSTERGVQTVKQILTFGRGLEGEKVPLQVDAVIQELLTMVRGTFPKDVQIESEVEPQLHPVSGDATQLHQVLLNLCVNARDAMPDGGKLRLRASNLEVDAGYASMLLDARPGHYVMLEISDTGTGIVADILEYMFEPFFTTKEAGQGTGLGLSTVLGIVQSHGGFINVKTQLPGGTTFQICLPAIPGGPASRGDVDCALPPRGNGECILVVDDEAAVRTAARIAIESAGYRVLLAADGAEGVSIFATQRASIAMVITDLNMPHVDGVALIRALRNLAPNLPILVSTCLGGKLRRSQLKELKIETILNKPYGADLLLRRIHDVLQCPVR